MFVNAKADPDLRSNILTKGADAVIELAWAAQVKGTGVSYADMFTEYNNWPHGSHHGLADLETIGLDLDVLSLSIKNVLAENWNLMGTVGPVCPN